MRLILVGIDDTDNRASRGTGCLSRRLAERIGKTGAGKVKSISRHQLFLHRDIPYTSKNSSACMSVETKQPEKLVNLCRDFILKESAEGSDAGLAVSGIEKIGGEIIDFGLRAKKEVLTLGTARTLAGHCGIYLEGLTGGKEGIIGALAALGLRRWGNDGRCIWLEGRELRSLRGVYHVGEIGRITGIDAVIDTDGKMIRPGDRIGLGNWVRPVIRNDRILLVAEKAMKNNSYEWKVASAEYIRSISD